MNYFPVFLDAQKIHALVIGGGNVAARKIELLLKTPANISIVSKRCNNTVRNLISEHGINYIQGDYQPKYLKHKTLVIAATNDSEINQLIAADAHALGLLINVVDSPDLCNYITPAIIDRSPMLVAISSEGSAPILLQMLRNKIETSLPESYGKLAKFCKTKRLSVQQNIEQFAQRRQFWKTVLEGDIARYILAGDNKTAERLFNITLQQQNHIPTSKLNIVILHSDEPDHLTLKAFQTLQQCDQIYFGANVSSRFYDYVRRDSEKYHELCQKQLLKSVKNNKQVAILILANDLSYLKDIISDIGFNQTEDYICGQ